MKHTLSKLVVDSTWRGVFLIYKVGDHLVHPGHGGCTIQRIEKREFGGNTALYFIMIPACDPHTTILVPVDNIDKIGLRDLISVKEADRILSCFSTQKAEWNCDGKKRQQTYEATMKNGVLEEIAKMINELLVHDKISALSNFEKGILPKAQKKLFSEIALVKDMDVNCVFNLVNHMVV